MQKKLHLENSAAEFLRAFDKFDTPGLRRTPERFASIFLNGDGTEDPEELLKSAVIPEVKYEGMIVENGLSFISFCEHHLLPFFGTATLAYIPKDKSLIVGLSKLPRVLRCIASGPNLQETITQRVADVIDKILEPKAVGVVLSATHLCMAARGVRIDNAVTVTSVLKGIFLEPGSSARAEFLNLRRRDG